MTTDLSRLDPLVRAVVAAAADVDRDNLDDTEVHVCDRGDDAVRRKALFGARRSLSEALADAGLTIPRE